MSKILIKNALIINEGKKYNSDVLIQNDVIFKISKNIIQNKDFKVIDATNKILIPGIIDDQVHFREPGLTHKASIETESRAAIAGGITSYIEMPNTLPNTTTIKELDRKFKIAEKKSYANFSFMFGGTNDNLDEIIKLDKNKVAALKLFLGSSTGNMLVDNEKALEDIFKNSNLLIAVHSEDEKIIRQNMEFYKNKYGDDIPFSFHPKIRSEESCLKSTKKIIKLAKKTGARLHVFHLSTKSETKLFNNKVPLDQKRITSEVCVHHLWFCDHDYINKKSYIKWNPAIKTLNDSEALWDGLNSGLLDVLATDHAPHTIKEKLNSYNKAPSGGPLVQHSLSALLTAYHQNRITLEKIVEKACHNPAILFDIKNRGYIREGFFADLVIIDLDKKHTVNKKDLLYKCGWSPFEGITFKGIVEKTLLNGQWGYNQGKILPKSAAMALTFDR